MEPTATQEEVAARPAEQAPEPGYRRIQQAVAGALQQLLHWRRTPTKESGRRFLTADQVPAEWQEGDEILNTYKVTGILGTGGMSKVYQVRHLGWNVDLAVKSPRPEILQQHGAAENFSREADTWVNLGRHPHIVSCLYVRTLGGTPRLFAEYVEGGSLKEWIEEGRLYEGRRDQVLERMLDVAIQVAWGLAFAHRQELVHRDVKPANVMMVPDGTAKVTDFGLARASPTQEVEILNEAGDTVQVTRGGMSLLYCSPEQYSGFHLSHRTDIWSWAVTVLETFVGEVAWAAGQVANYALENYLQSGSRYPYIPAMPAALARLLGRCLHKSPTERPATMDEVATAVQEIYRQEIGSPYSRHLPEAVELLPASLNNQALSLLDLDRRADAEQTWEKALRLEPNHPESVYNLGLLRWRSTRSADDHLVQQLKAVCASHPGEWLPVYLLALVHLERGDCQEVIRLLEGLDRQDLNRDEVQAALLPARKLLPQSRRLLHTFSAHTGAVRSVSLSEDGAWALSGGDDKAVRLWDLAEGRCTRILAGHEGRISSVWLGADGRYALSGSRDEVLSPKLWRLSGTHPPTVLRGHGEGSTSVCLSTDGRYALSGGVNGTLKLWDTAVALNPDVGMGSDPCLRTLQGHQGCVNAVSLSMGWHLALSGGDDQTLRVWDIENGRCLRTLEGHTGSILAVCLSRDGCYALSGGADRTLRFWDLETGRCVREFEGHGASVTAAYLSADGRFALSGGADQTLRWWEVDSGRCLCTLQGHAGGANAVCLDAKGWFALSGGQDRTVKLWYVHMESTPPAPMRISPWMGEQIVFPAQSVLTQARAALEAGEAAAAAQYLRAVRAQPGYRRHLEAVNAWGQLYVRLARKSFGDGWEWATLEGHAGAVLAVGLSASGRYAISGSADGTLRLWDIAAAMNMGGISGPCLRTFEGHTGPVTAVEMGADAAFVLSGSADGTVKVWDVGSGYCLRTLGGNAGPVTAVGQVPDGSVVISGSADGTLRLWQVASSRCLRTWAGHAGRVTAICVSADGQSLLSGSADKTLKVWDLPSSQCLRTFKGLMDQVTAVSWSADGRYALSGSTDSSIRLWEIESGRCLRTFGGHAGAVFSAHLSMDGRFALSGGADRTVRLWDVESGRCLRIFRGHAEAVLAAGLNADGRFALSGSADHALKLWLLDWELEDNLATEWDERARPYLKAFLTRHTPCAATLPADRQPAPEEVTMALTRQGDPLWSEGDFQRLLYTLGCAGYGWLRPGGVRRELERVAKNVRLTRFSPLAVYTYALQQAQGARETGDCVAAAQYLRIARAQPGYQYAAEAIAEWSRLYLSLARRFFQDRWELGSLGGHAGAVLTLAQSPDGRLVLSGSADHTLRLWELPEGRCLHTLVGHTGEVNAVFLAGDGRLALSGSADQTVRLWEVPGGRCLRILEGHAGPVTGVSLAGDGRFILSGSADRTLRLWEVAHGRALRTFEGHTDSVSAVYLGVDGRQALSGSADRTLRLWDVVHGHVLRTLDGHLEAVTAVCLSMDGRFALSGSVDGTVKYWDVVSGRCLHTLREHAGAVVAVCLSTDGRFAFSAGADKAIRLWDMSNGFCLRTFEDQAGTMTAMSLNQEGQHLLLGYEAGGIRRWLLDWEVECNLAMDWDEGARSYLKTFLAAHMPYGGALPVGRPPTAREVTSALAREGTPVWSEEDFLRLTHTLGCAGYGWLRPDGVRRELARMVQAEHQFQVMPDSVYARALELAQQVRVAGDTAAAARYLRTARDQAGYQRAAGALSEWAQLYLALPRSSFQNGWEWHAFEGHTGEVTSVCLSLDGRLVLSGSADRTLKVWAMPAALDAGGRRERCLCTLEGHSATVTAVSLSADGRLAVSGSEDGTIKGWEVAEGRCLRTMAGHANWVLSVAMSQDGRYALSGSLDKTLKLWDVRSGHCLRTFAGHTDAVRSVCLSMDGLLALSGSTDKTLKLWDVRTGRCLRTFKGHRDWVSSVGWSMDGRRALSGSADHTLRLWDVRSGSCLRTLEGHTASIFSVCLGADGNFALSGGNDNALRLWDIRSGRCVSTSQGHTWGVNAAVLSANGCFVLSASYRTIKVWLLDWQLEETLPADWDDGARPCLEMFLSAHTPRAGILPAGREPTDHEVVMNFTPWGLPVWSEDDFRQLLYLLGCAGYGWLRPEGVRQQLDQMTQSWQGADWLG